MAHQLVLLLSRLGIRARVLGGFALTLVFLIGLASLAVTQMGLLGGTVDTLVLSAEGDAGMSGVRLAMVSANVSAEHFIRTRNLGDLAAAKGAIDRLETAFKDAAAKFTPLPAVASSKDGLAQQIADYHAAFDAVSAAVDKVRVATAKTEVAGAAAGLQAAAITAGLVNEPLQAGAPEAALLPPATDTLRAALAHYTLTGAKSDANEAHLALGFVTDALASYQKQGGQLDARMQKLTGLLQASAGDDDKALADLEAANAGLTEAQGRFTKASDAIDKGIAGISSGLGASRTQQGIKTAQEVDSTRSLIMMVAAGAVIVGAFLAWLIGRSVSGPLLKITARMQSLAAGDLDRAIPGGDHHDEIGRMATAIEVFRENALAVRRMEAGAAAEREAAEANRRRLMLELADRFERGVEGVIHSVTESTRHMGVSAHELAKLAEEGRQLAESVAARSEQASGNVQTVSAATQQLSASITEISSQVSRSVAVSTKAKDEAGNSAELMRGLSEAAERIGNVVQLIRTIASQTNLLALNATIEAARAGDAGKGFAVVASEVKALANQTEHATGEIAGQVQAIQDATGRSVVAIQIIGQTVGEMTEIATTIASAIEEQSAATGEIARNVDAAAQGTARVSADIAAVQQVAGNTDARAEAGLTPPGELEQQATLLKSSVGEFLRSVRA